MVSRLTAGMLFLVFLSSAAVAEDVKTYEIEEVVVTATKQEAKPEDVPQPVTLINRKEIENSPAYNVGEMLDFVPGVRIISSGTVGASQGVSMRSLNGGPGSNKTLVLLDGRPMNDAWSGNVNFNSLPLDMIDHVEVVRGAASALYGSQATAGVINVFTKRPEPGFHGWLSLGHELNASKDITNASDDGYGRAEIAASRFGLNGSYGGEKSDHFFSFSYRNATESFPTPEEDDWDNTDLFYRGTYKASEDLTTGVTLDIHDDTWANHTDSTPQDVDSKTVAADVSAIWTRGIGKLTGRLYLNRVTSENRIYSTDITTGQTSNRFGLQADYSMPIGDSSFLVAGVDGFFDNADVDYTNTVVNMKSLGVQTINYADSRTGTVSQVDADTFQGTYGSNSQKYDESNVALYAQYTRLITDKFNAVAGGRLDMHSEFGTVFNPKLGLTYELLEVGDMVTTVKANYGTAFRAPPMVDLFSQSLGGYGNSDMEPEKTKNTDIGIFQRFGSLGSLELTFFHMDVTDLMINDKLGSTGDGYYVIIPNGAAMDTLSFNQRKNLGNYSPKGFEAGVTLRPHKQLTLSGTYSYLDPGDFTFQTSKNRFNLGALGFVPVGENRVEGEITYRHTGDGYFFDYETRPYDAFATSDARLSFAYRDKGRISLYVKNMFDETYKLWHYAWQPGRTVLISIETRY